MKMICILIWKIFRIVEWLTALIFYPAAVILNFIWNFKFLKWYKWTYTKNPKILLELMLKKRTKGDEQLLGAIILIGVIFISWLVFWI